MYILLVLIILMCYCRTQFFRIVFSIVSSMLVVFQAVFILRPKAYARSMTKKIARKDKGYRA